MRPSRKASILGLWMPARSYPTLRLNTKPSGSPRASSLASSLQANHALMYSAIAWGTVSSVDHSQLYPSSAAEMQGLGTHLRSSSPSMTWTVFSSKNRAPAA